MAHSEGRPDDVEADETESALVFRQKEGDHPNRKSPFTKQNVLLIVLAAAVVVIIVLVIALIATNVRKSEVCDTIDCVKIAGAMASKMNLSIDPCDDFFEYACSAYEKSDTLPPDRSHWGVFNDLHRITTAALKRALEMPGNYFNSSAIEKAKLIYKTCMNTTATEEAGGDQMLKVIDSVGYWPALSSATWEQRKSSWVLETVLAKAHRLQVYPLFSFFIDPDDKNSKVQTIKFDQEAQLTLSNPAVYKNSNASTKIQPHFEKFFVEVASLLGQSNAVEAKEAAAKVWQFETALAESLDDPANRTDSRAVYHRLSVRELQSLMDNEGVGVINMETFLHNMFGRAIPGSEKVIVYAPDFMQKMSALIKTAEKTTLANYVAWHVVLSFLPFLPVQFRLAKSNFVLVTKSGSEGLGDQWDTCVRLANKEMAMATGALYVAGRFGPEEKQLLSDVLLTIRNTMTDDLLPNANWIDQDTLQLALEKARGMKQKVAYPDFILDPQKLDAYYENLTVVSSLAAFINIMASRTFHVDRSLAQLGQAPGGDIWEPGPVVVNAFYNPHANEIMIFAGILQKPFFDKTFPKSLVFGGIGMVMGHEMSHGFDNNGRLYDKDGNLKDWWTEKASVAFTEKAECLVTQYSQEIIEGEHLNGLTTLGENIADNGGLKLAYKAFLRWAYERDYTEPKLPGLNMSPDQLFFLSFSQLYCTYYTPGYAKQSLQTDSHSHPKYRVIDTLRNMPAFAKVFNCPVGSSMNPESKCAVW